MTKQNLKTLIPTCIALMAATAGNAKDMPQTPAEFTLHQGLSFSSETPALTLDLYVPQQTPKPIPCVIVIQGGGFRAQDGQRFQPFAEYLANNGFAAALISYRGLPDHTCQETVADVKAAVRYIRQVSGDYDLDPNRIGAMGRSAGATLVALLVVGEGTDAFQDQAEEGQFSSQIQAAVGIAGVYDFVSRYTDEAQIALQNKRDAKIKSNGRWIGAPFDPTNKDWLAASAINHVDAKTPPMLLLHSTDDPVVPWQQTRQMYDAMQEAGIASEIDITAKGGHAGPKNSKQSMVAFFKKVLVEQDPTPDTDQ